ncbi:MAG: hypothetical protein PHV77_05920 [Candidatus Omnitrophica bacterium]|nr:hypothetical protein [Candidatus Omnitrophota bacterium]
MQTSYFETPCVLNGSARLSSRAAGGGGRVVSEGSGSEVSIRFLASLGMTIASLGMTEMALGYKNIMSL